MSTAVNEFGIRQPQGFPGLPAGWSTEVDSFLAADQKSRLFAFLWRKSEPAPVRKILMIAHGFGEHGGRYLHFPYYLQQSVDAIYVHDHRGHGRSDGLRGDAETFDALVDDLLIAVKRVHEKFPEAELHFLGHSMGGLIALRLGFLHPGLPLRTFQVSAPYLALYKEIIFPLRAAAVVLARTWSTLGLAADVDPKVVSRDPAVVENYGVDRLNHSKMTPRFYRSMVAAQKDTVRRTQGFNYPVVIHLPLADELVNAVATRAFFDALDDKEKRLVEYPDFRHEPMNEIGKEKFFEEIAAVIDSAGKLSS